MVLKNPIKGICGESKPFGITPYLIIVQMAQTQH